MIVYKYYLKTLYRMRRFLLLWMAIFVFFVAANVMGVKEEKYNEISLDVAMSKGSSQEYESLREYFLENANFMEIEASVDRAKELIYLGAVDIALIENEGGQIEYFTNPSSNKGRIASRKAKDYLKFLNITAVNGELDKELSTKISKEKVAVRMYKKDDKMDHTLKAILYNRSFSFLSYPLILTIMSMLGTAIIVFRNKEAMSRISLSAIKHSRYHLEMFLANLLAMIVIVCFGYLIAFVFFRYERDVPYLIYFVNIVSFAFSGLGLMYLLVNISPNKYFVSGSANILALIFAFFSGAFVPINFLPQLIRSIARFFPMFYYIKANSLAINGYSSDIGFYILIQLLFGIAFYLLGVFISRLKKEKV